MTPEEFRELLLQQSPEDIVDQYILTEDPGPHISRAALDKLQIRIREVFAVPPEHSISMQVVGSAKLGFAILDKPARLGRPYKPAYRAFDPGASDIDVAVVSPVVYMKLWHDLAKSGASAAHFPWRGELSAYMLHGWLRPDKFPTGGPPRCSDWRDLVNHIQRTEDFRYKKLRCGIFHSRYYLKIYQQRGVQAAQRAELDA